MWASGSRAIPNVPSFLAKGSATLHRHVKGPALASSAGALAWAAFPPSGPLVGPFLALLALIPLFLALRGAPPARAFGLGLVSGATMTGLGFAFLGRAASLHGHVSPLLVGAGFAALTAYHALFVALPCGAAALLARRVPLAIGLPVLLTLAEVLLPAPLPWAFGASLLDARPLAPAAAVFGGSGLSLVAFLVAGAASEQLGSRREPAARASLLASALVLGCAGAASMTYSSSFSREVAVAPTIRVGALHVPASEAGTTRRPTTLAARAAELGARGAELVVAPETALPGVWPESSLADGADWAFDAPGAVLLAGAVVRGDERLTNSAIVVDRGGAVVGRYDKRFLLPLAEAWPLPEGLRSLSPRSGTFSPGRRSPTFEVAGAVVGTTICLEDTLAGAWPTEGTRGAELFVNLTNDSWFAGTNEPFAHLAMARLRAIEHGRFLVRSTAGGVTSIVDPLGAVTARVDPDREGEVLADVPRLGARTPFARYGQAPLALLCALVVAVATATERRLSRGASAPS